MMRIGRWNLPLGSAAWFTKNSTFCTMRIF